MAASNQGEGLDAPATFALKEGWFFFRLWCVVFIVMFFPMDFIFRVDSLMKFHTLPEILVDAAIVILILGVFPMAFALLNTAAAFVGAMVSFGPAAQKVLIAINMTYAAAVLGNKAIKLARLWVLKVFEVSLHVPPSLKVGLSVLLMAVGYYLYKKGRIDFQWPGRVVRSLFKVCVVIWIAIAMVLVWRTADRLIVHWGSEVPPLQAFAGKASKELPNIVLITFDSLTAEDMSLHGYALQTTPNLDAFARESYYFENAYANSDWTRPALASILTGTYPVRHKQFGFYRSFSNYGEFRGTNLPAILKRNGYRNIAIVGNLENGHPFYNMTYSDFHVKPFDAGRMKNHRLLYLLRPFAPLLYWMGSDAFSWVNDIMSLFALKWIAPNANELITAGAEFGIASEYLDGLESPFFLWVHVMPPHLPYLPGPDFKGRFLKGEAFSETEEMEPYFSRTFKEAEQPDYDKLRLRYDETILDADDKFGEFLKVLREKSVLDNSLIIVSSDHGESFTHGLASHGNGLYNPAIRVPLIFHFPGQRTSAAIKGNAEHVDIAPTVLEFLGLPVPPGMQGESLVPAIFNGTESSRPKYSVSIKENSIWGKFKKGSAAVIKEKYKYIYNIGNDTGELYDLADDPRESRDVSKQEPQRTRELRALVLDMLSD